MQHSLRGGDLQLRLLPCEDMQMPLAPEFVSEEHQTCNCTWASTFPQTGPGTSPETSWDWSRPGPLSGLVQAGPGIESWCDRWYRISSKHKLLDTCCLSRPATGPPKAGPGTVAWTGRRQGPGLGTLSSLDPGILDYHKD